MIIHETNITITVKCENEKCGKTIDLSCDLEDLGQELTKNGWSWLRGDEAYDHVCSDTCRTEININKE